MIVDLLHDLGGNVMRPTRGDERSLEPSVAPNLCQPRRAGPRLVDNRYPADVVRHVGSDHQHGNQEAECVDHAEGLSPRDLLSCVVSPGRAGNGGCSSNTPSIDDPGRGFTIAAFSFSDHLVEPCADLLPGPVFRPGHVIAVHSIPVRIATGQCPPLTPCRRHVENRDHDVALLPLGGSSDPAGTGVGRDEIGDELPLFIGQITLGGPPGSRYGTVGVSHLSSIWDLATRWVAIMPFIRLYFHDSLVGESGESWSVVPTPPPLRGADHPFRDSPPSPGKWRVWLESLGGQAESLWRVSMAPSPTPAPALTWDGTERRRVWRVLAPFFGS